jgi:hypothetical protein
VSIALRTPNNIYILNDIGKEICCLVRENETCLPHKIIGNTNFYNLIKINRKEAVREMPEISKSASTMCKHFLQRKKTRTEFRSKEYSMTKPLEIVHTNICGPVRTKGLNGKQYFMLLVDDYTRMNAVCFIKKKSYAFENFRMYKEMIEIEMDSRIKFLR